MAQRLDKRYAPTGALPPSTAIANAEIYTMIPDISVPLFPLDRRLKYVRNTSDGTGSVVNNIATDDNGIYL